MASKDREGNVISEEGMQNTILKRLYGTEAGRRMLKLLVRPAVSKAGGIVLNARPSALFIPTFIERSGINMEEYEEESYESYNHFFTRRLKEGRRTFSETPELLCAPCDGRLSVYPIEEGGRFMVKGVPYTMDSLVRSKKLAGKYLGGTLCVFRLTVKDYHHYAYIDTGEKTKNYRIPGVFHTVNPLANRYYPVYAENTREFSVLKSRNFGKVLMMEVGALFVGRIVNHHGQEKVRRGMEKGYFEFGGSTVILAFEKGRAVLDSDILENQKQGFETIVKMGETIGQKANVPLIQPKRTQTLAH